MRRLQPLLLRRKASPNHFQLTSPVPGQSRKGPGLEIRAQLIPRSSAEQSFPESLTYRVTDGAGATVQEGVLTGPGGVYTGTVETLDEGSYSVAVGCAAQARTAAFTIDSTPPVVTAVVAPPSRSGETGFTVADPSSANAWRRDEVAVLRVTSTEPINAADSRISMQGPSGAAVLAPALSPVTPCAQPACAETGLELWRPTLDAFRGTFAVSVTVADAAGNTATTNVTVPVTRWKWAFDAASGPVSSTPAVGGRGVVYFGTRDSSGQVFALNPQGTSVGSSHWVP